jgi:hypothetical protein
MGRRSSAVSRQRRPPDDRALGSPRPAQATASWTGQKRRPPVPAAGHGRRAVGSSGLLLRPRSTPSSPSWSTSRRGRGARPARRRARHRRRAELAPAPAARRVARRRGDRRPLTCGAVSEEPTSAAGSSPSRGPRPQPRAASRWLGVRGGRRAGGVELHRRRTRRSTPSAARAVIESSRLDGGPGSSHCDADQAAAAHALGRRPASSIRLNLPTSTRLSEATFYPTGGRACGWSTTQPPPQRLTLLYRCRARLGRGKKVRAVAAHPLSAPHRAALRWPRCARRSRGPPRDRRRRRAPSTPTCIPSGRPGPLRTGRVAARHRSGLTTPGSPPGGDRTARGGRGRLGAAVRAINAPDGTGCGRARRQCAPTSCCRSRSPACGDAGGGRHRGSGGAAERAAIYLWDGEELLAVVTPPPTPGCARAMDRYAVDRCAPTRHLSHGPRERGGAARRAADAGRSRPRAPDELPVAHEPGERPACWSATRRSVAVGIPQRGGRGGRVGVDASSCCPGRGEVVLPDQRAQHQAGSRSIARCAAPTRWCTTAVRQPRAGPGPRRPQLVVAGRGGTAATTAELVAGAGRWQVPWRTEAHHADHLTGSSRTPRMRGPPGRWQRRSAALPDPLPGPLHGGPHPLDPLRRERVGVNWDGSKCGKVVLDGVRGGGVDVVGVVLVVGSAGPRRPLRRPSRRPARRPAPGLCGRGAVMVEVGARAAAASSPRRTSSRCGRPGRRRAVNALRPG